MITQLILIGVAAAVLFALGLLKVSVSKETAIFSAWLRVGHAKPYLEAEVNLFHVCLTLKVPKTP